MSNLHSLRDKFFILRKYFWLASCVFFGRGLVSSGPVILGETSNLHVFSAATGRIIRSVFHINLTFLATHYVISRQKLLSNSHTFAKSIKLLKHSGISLIQELSNKHLKLVGMFES